MKETREIKVIVKENFPDRYTGLVHKKGEEMTATYDRLAEIRRSGDYVEVVKEPAAPKAAEPKEKK